MSYLDLKIMATHPLLTSLNKQYIFAKSDGLYLTRLWGGSQGIAGPLPVFPLTIPEPTPLELGPAGVVYPTQTYHTIDTNALAPSGDLNNMILPGDYSGFNLVILRPLDDARSIVVKHVTNGYIHLRGGVDITLDDVTDHILLFYMGWTWVNITT